ncbi:MAG: ATP-binding protein [Oceanicaulis sp.]
MSQLIRILDASAISEARRATRAAAQAAGLGQAKLERAVLVASETATNLHRHAVNGRFSATVSLRGDLVLLGLDDGPGMENPARMMQDQVSTGSSLGVGLGAMERLSDRFELWSRAGAGTVTACVFEIEGATAPEPPGLDGLRVAAPGQAACGDVFAWRTMRAGVQVLLCDGFGHGETAARDAERIRAAFEAASGDAGTVMQTLCAVDDMHRGAVALVADLPRDGGRLTAAGVGNIAGAIVTRETTRRLISREGSVGRRCKVQAETYDLPPDALLVLHSDGLKTFRFEAQHRDLFYRSSLAAAAIILRERLRGPDDASIIVLGRPGGDDE